MSKKLGAVQTLFFICTSALLANCATHIPPTNNQLSITRPSIAQTPQDGILAYQRVAARIKPIATTICRDFNRDFSASFCNFQLNIDRDKSKSPNAYQTIRKDGIPIITFNINMLRTVKNDSEIAFIMGHEAGHQIARHLLKKQHNANTGAILGAILASSLGIDPEAGVKLGSSIGAISYSKLYEFQADRIAAHIADRAGYNVLLGANSFAHTDGSNGFFSSHPIATDRYQKIQQVVAEIQAAKSQGRISSIQW